MASRVNRSLPSPYVFEGKPHGRPPHMPVCHFRPEGNWVNDPLGLTKVGDLYHLFYQYNPVGAEPGLKHWGHAISQDLVAWEILPLALSPTPGGPDEGGCWSGSVTTLVDPPHLFYTAVRHDPRRGRIETVCLALGDAGLREWRKHPDVLIPGPPADLDTYGFRDPFVWRDGDQWCLLVGSGIRGVGGAVLIYRSDDLRRWRYDGVFFSMADMRAEDETAAMWECPQLFQLQGRYVLLLSIDSAAHPVLYVTGRLDGSKFAAERIGRLDIGPEFYAPSCFVDDDGRALVIAWAPEARSGDAQVAAGWSGVMTLPRAMTLDTSGRLRSSPTGELSRLRRRHWQSESIALPSGVNVVLPITGCRLEMIATVRPGQASTLGLRIRKSPDGRETTLFSIDTSTGTVIFDRRDSSLAPEVMPTVHEFNDGWLPGALIQLHVFIDESIVELFIDDVLALTGRVYPSRTDSVGLEVFSLGGSAVIDRIDAWQLDMPETSKPRGLGLS